MTSLTRLARRSAVLFPRIPFRSQVAFALVVSALWMLAYNLRFWSEVFGALWRADVPSTLFVFALATLVLVVQALLLLLVPTRRGLQAVAAVLCVIGSVSAYFTAAFGAVMNVEMMRNVFQTDAAETRDLINISMVLHVLLLGVVPAIFAWRARVPESASWRRQLGQRAAFIATGLAVSFVLAYVSSASYAVFLREHKPLRSMLSPVSVVYSSGALLASRLSSGGETSLLPDPGGTPWKAAEASPAATRRKPVLLVLVVGETARAANFQLGGYARATTPKLAARDDILYFANASSCGTSTAISVPCLFSQSGRAGFSPARAPRIPNFLDVLRSAAVDVQWLDNNSGCKGVCARVPTIDYFTDAAARAASTQCSEAHCFDSILSEGLAQQLADTRAAVGDRLIVLHQNGSHGPAYFERYPPHTEQFQPACHSNRLDACTRDEVVNAYDNSIRYTDQVLATQIEMLQSLQSRFDTVLIYASDHGESLGEQGIFLHGMPYAFAPSEQTHVPMLMWMSEGYRSTHHLNAACLAARTRGAVSHDNIFPTVMGAFGLRNLTYRGGLDLISACAQPRGVLASTKP